jgi:hypothetical protein
MIALFVIVQCVFFSYFAHAQSQSPRTLRTQRLEIVNPDGRVCARLETTRSGTGLTIFDAQNNKRIAISFEEDQGVMLPSIRLLKKNGLPMVRIQGDDHGQGSVLVLDTRSKSGQHAGLSPSGLYIDPPAQLGR